MKTIKFTEENGGKEAWLNFRLGKWSGSKGKDIMSSRGGRKLGSYQLVAESILGSAALAEEEDPMARGTRLEPESIARFRAETGKKVDDSLIVWVREDDGRMMYSPDGVISLTAAVETKSLSSARHLEAKITGKIPKDYEPQAIQAFVVNDKLKTLFFVFYDPRFPKGLDFFYFELTRKQFAKEIAEFLAFERAELQWVRDTVNALTLHKAKENAVAGVPFVGTPALPKATSPSAV